MESAASEIVTDFPPMLRAYKDGRIERFLGTQIVLPAIDPKTNVESKDIVYSQEISKSVRTYIPPNAAGKLPLLVYFHGGAFCIETAYFPTGSDDQCINPIDDPSFGSLGCNRVLVCVAEKDILKHRGVYYCEKLKQSGWGGEVELMEAKGEGHVFHLHNPSCENAAAKLKKVADLINNSKA
ncbi:putative Carboxyesterase 13 [Hibiscus syriacus]|uniref:Carboxyesterase 13 n=1 Tax=Hibiscus syriacus TaxID=106335 RepID=A0A6A2Z504_HIBSY|nr:putative Carboxyesterase 13 [Hibiscus syriacus]